MATVEDNRMAGRVGKDLDRTCPPRETVDRLRPHFRALGITRLARQTGLDTIGIPCFSAIRPNARTLACSQGKGVDDDAAMASAVMEAAEFALAEREMPPAWFGSAATLQAMDASWFDPQRLLPFGQQFDLDRPLAWLAGRNVVSGGPVLIPRDAVRFDGETPDLIGIAQSTNGLASGNTPEEAEFHGVCELVERDASSLWSLLSAEQQAKSAFDPARLQDPVVDRLVARVAAANLRLQLFDLTSDIGVPTVMALIGPVEGWRYFEAAAGTGTHPVPARAAQRAITEAAQSRITSIAGARDDVPTAQYETTKDAAVSDLLVVPCTADPPIGLTADAGRETARTFLRRALATAGITDPVAASLGGESFGISVVRVLSQVLEDREANPNWRPGARAVERLLEAA
jgi:YcaO-like protein with predicted kinase domain